MLDFGLISAAGLGLALHQYFKRHEPYPLRAFLTLLGSEIILQAAAMYLTIGPTALSNWIAVVRGVMFSGLITTTTLFVSIAVYRLSPWHPLASYPGPWLHRLTKLRVAWASWHGNNYRELQALHRKYGPVVRIAPNELSIAEVSAIQPVYNMPKDKWYRGRQPFDGGRNILATNGVQHAHRRKMWDRGLGKEQILSYSASAERIAKQLITQLDLDAAQGTSVNLTKWVRYFAYDFMSIFAFGKEAGMTRAGDDPTGIIKKMSDALVITDFNAQLWWLGPGAQQFPIPRLITPIVSFLRVSNGILAERAARETDSYDLWHYLTNKEVTQKLSTSDLVRETVAAVIAGADTVANAAVNTVYLLLKNRQCLARARDEVDGMVHRGFEPWSDIEVHKDMPYLNACIDEALRLFPVVPVNGSRSIPSGSGGKVISNYFVPENTEVYVPQCVLHTSEQHFSPEPLAYHPERWLPAEGSNNKWHTNRNAFFPFSFGAQNCVGKNLARIEMVLLLSMLLHSYDMTFAQDFDVEEFPSSMHEHIVAEVGPMNIRLTKRSTPKE